MENLAEVIALYRQFEKQYDIWGIAGCFQEYQRLAAQEMAAQEMTADDKSFFYLRRDVIVFAALTALQYHEGQRAIDYLSLFSDETINDDGFLSLRAMCCYELKQWELAGLLFDEAYQNNPGNELLSFYRGNIHFQQGNWRAAAEAYLRALGIRKGFFEARVNAVLALRRLGEKQSAANMVDHSIVQKELVQGRIMLYPWKYSLGIGEMDYRKIPIFINSRDRLGCLEKVMDWFLKAGYENIYIMDMASTYQPLLEYYRNIQRRGIFVVYCNQNLGHTALWASGILEKLQIMTPYVYTDSDVVPDERCPMDFLQRYLEVLQQYPLIKKVGSGLRVDDITYFGAAKTQRYEREFYHAPVGPDMYYAPVDTTLALYRNYRHYHVGGDIRMTGPYMARHLPWYYDYEQLPEDELYYMQHANHSSTMSQKAKAAMEEK